jgi:hypothetical protein
VRVIAELDRSARGPFPFDIALPRLKEILVFLRIQTPPTE